MNVRSNAPKTLSQVATDEPDPSHLRIRLTGTNHHWVAEYLPSERGGAVLRSHFATGDFHIPVNTPVVLLLNSTDYMYALAIPDLHLKEIAVPELEFQMELPPLGCGRFPLVAGEMCGIPGLEPPGRLIVEPRAMFNQWLHDNEELTL